MRWNRARIEEEATSWARIMNEENVCVCVSVVLYHPSTAQHKQEKCIGCWCHQWERKKESEKGISFRGDVKRLKIKFVCLWHIFMMFSVKFSSSHLLIFLCSAVVAVNDILNSRCCEREILLWGFEAGRNRERFESSSQKQHLESIKFWQRRKFCLSGGRKRRKEKSSEKVWFFSTIFVSNCVHSKTSEVRDFGIFTYFKIFFNFRTVNLKFAFAGNWWFEGMMGNMKQSIEATLASMNWNEHWNIFSVLNAGLHDCVFTSSSSIANKAMPGTHLKPLMLVFTQRFEKVMKVEEAESRLISSSLSLGRNACLDSIFPLAHTWK